LEKSIVLLSLARGLRLATYVTPLRHLFFVIKRLIPTYSAIMRLLMVLYFVFVSVGRFAFGGMIYNTNPLLAGTSFASSGYWTMNFNDCPSGLVTLLVLMIVNSWNTISLGYVAVTKSNWTPLFFVAFFILCNLVVLNILIALILDCTEVLTEEMEKEEQKAWSLGH